jgi:hypothetical protein
MGSLEISGALLAVGALERSCHETIGPGLAHSCIDTKMICMRQSQDATKEAMDF